MHSTHAIIMILSGNIGFFTPEMTINEHAGMVNITFGLMMSDKLCEEVEISFSVLNINATSEVVQNFESTASPLLHKGLIAKMHVMAWHSL